MRVSYFGIEDMADALYRVAEYFKDPAMMERTQELVRNEIEAIYAGAEALPRRLSPARKRPSTSAARSRPSPWSRPSACWAWTWPWSAPRPAPRKIISELAEISDPGTIIVDDSNPLELTAFLEEKDVDIFVGGVKERPIAYKLGVGFCDHNHERKEALAGFGGMLNFAQAKSIPRS